MCRPTACWASCCQRCDGTRAVWPAPDLWTKGHVCHTLIAWLAWRCRDLRVSQLACSMCPPSRQAIIIYVVFVVPARCAVPNILRALRFLRPLCGLQTLFFVRLGADLVGRTIPRLKGAAMTSQARHVPAANDTAAVPRCAMSSAVSHTAVSSAPFQHEGRYKLQSTLMRSGIPAEDLRLAVPCRANFWRWARCPLRQRRSSSCTSRRPRASTMTGSRSVRTHFPYVCIAGAILRRLQPSAQHPVGPPAACKSGACRHWSPLQRATRAYSSCCLPGHAPR